jgi:hypothetical protein
MTESRILLVGVVRAGGLAREQQGLVAIHPDLQRVEVHLTPLRILEDAALEHLEEATLTELPDARLVVGKEGLQIVLLVHEQHARRVRSRVETLSELDRQSVQALRPADEAVRASGWNHHHVVLGHRALQISQHLTGTRVEDHHRVNGMHVRLQDLAFLETNPAHREARIRRDEAAELVVPAEVAQLTKLVDFAPLRDGLNGRDRIARDHLHLEGLGCRSGY